MPLVILCLFIAVPILEIAVFIQVGDILGLWPTIALVLLTAIGGIALLRTQGLATLQRAQASLERGEAPLRAAFDGACLMIAGVLLLIPGFVTDALALILVLPPVRGAMFSWLGGAVRAGKIHVRGGGFGHQRPDPAPGQRPLDIEGDYRDITPPEDPPDAPPDTPPGIGRK